MPLDEVRAPHVDDEGCGAEEDDQNDDEQDNYLSSLTVPQERDSIQHISAPVPVLERSGSRCTLELWPCVAFWEAPDEGIRYVTSQPRYSRVVMVSLMNRSASSRVPNR